MVQFLFTWKHRSRKFVQNSLFLNLWLTGLTKTKKKLDLHLVKGQFKHTRCSRTRVANYQALALDLRLCVILQIFSRIFYVCSKPRPILFPLQNNQQVLDSCKIIASFCKRISVGLDKTGRVPSPLEHLLCLDRPMSCGNAHIRHFAKFSDFLETQCWQPWLECT